MKRSRQPNRRQRLDVTPPSRGIPLALLRLPLASAVSAVLAGGAPLAYAATASDTASTDTLEEVTVTAQKVTENLQNVPISIETLSTQKLEQLNISNFDDYVKYLPGVTTVKGLGQGGNAVGTTHVYMRGVVSGQDGNHSALAPERRHLFRRTAGDDDRRHARHPCLRHRPDRSAGGSAGHPLWREFRGRHHPHHHQQARSQQVRGRLRCRAATPSITAARAGTPRASSTSRITPDGGTPGRLGCAHARVHQQCRGNRCPAGILNGHRSFPTWSASTGDTLTVTPDGEYNTSNTRAAGPP